MKRKRSSLEDWLQYSKSLPYCEQYYDGKPELNEVPDVATNSIGDETQARWSASE